jgi:uncharacterized protein (DUF2147 family)
LIRQKFLGAALFTIVLTATPALAATSVQGRWLTPAKDSVIEIAPCGAKLCGRVTKILRPDPKGPATDAKNPNPALRSRPILGLAILSDFTDAGSQWSGTIYDPRNGKSYRSNVARNADGTLKVQGCIAFFCQTQTWTKAP